MASRYSGTMGRRSRRESAPPRSNRAKNQPMSEYEIVGFLGRKILQSMNDESGDLSDVRQENFNYYVGKEYGDERDGYSKFVTREVLETVEWVLPSVLRVFLSGDQVVTFDPVGPDDEDTADQETDITNYFVMRKNKGGEGGFLTLHHWMKDCLMYPTGYIKCYMEEKEHTDVGVLTGLTEMAVQILVNDTEVDILEQRSRTIENSEFGQPYEVYDLKIRTTKKVMQLRIDPVPPEECLVDNDCTSQNLDEADFVCHRTRKSFTRLVNEGIDPDELDEVGLSDDYQWNDERVNRLFYEDEDPDAQDEDDASMREFWVHECYGWFDNDGTGVAQWRRVLLIGDKVFENEEINYQPMVGMSSILMQHKHPGMGFIEIVKDLQLLSSTLVRQLLDNTYKQNVDKAFISEDALTEDGSTMEALLNTMAEYVPVRGPAQAAVMKNPPNSVIQQLLPVIEWVKTSRADRTGVTPETAVDPNALQEIRQEVFTNALDRASQRIEMLVRIFAETGYRQLFIKAHQLLRSHWDMETTVKLRGEWIEVDPQGWRDRTDVTVNVGLGFNTKTQQLGMLVQLLSMQKEALAAGLSDYPKMYKTLERLVTAAGLGDVRQYFVDPESQEFKPPEPKPDPQAILAQAQAEALTREQDRKDKESQSEQMGKQAEAQQKVMEMQATREEGQQDRQIKVREMALREVELEKKYELDEGELRAKIRNINADTRKKEAEADKAMVEAAGGMIENSETFQKAVDIVADAAEENDIGDLDGESETDTDQEKSESENRD